MYKSFEIKEIEVFGEVGSLPSSGLRQVMACVSFIEKSPSFGIMIPLAKNKISSQLASVGI